MTDSQATEALLFDLGGVVIAIDFERVFQHWARYSTLPPSQIRARFAVDTAYERHERGELDGAGYFAHVRRLLALDASDEQIAAGWNALFAGQIDEALALVRQAHARRPCFCFTNTNPTHQAAWSTQFPGVVALFDEIFVSSELGLRKPERLAFETVAERIGVAPSRVLFFDDLRQNVEGARAAGMQAVQVEGPADIRRALAERRLL